LALIAKVGEATAARVASNISVLSTPLLIVCVTSVIGDAITIVDALNIVKATITLALTLDDKRM
jgi:hypothetical protein